MTYRSINPATEEPIHEYDEISDEQLQQVLRDTQAAYAEWRNVPIFERGMCLTSTADLLREQQDSLAELATREMGKPLEEAKAEVEKCAWVCEYYAENAAEFLQHWVINTDASKTYVRFDPIGVVLAVMPWNFPFWQVFRCAAPILMAGNTMLLKHASNVGGVATRIDEIFREAGLPNGCFTNVFASRDQTGDLVTRGEIAGVTLTGSEKAGRAIAKLAGEQLKPSVFELGGSDPFIVLADADPVAVAESAVKARTKNAGQSCIAAKRFIVEQSLLEAFESAFLMCMSNLKVGDPFDSETDLGPMARCDLRDELHSQVERSVQAGAKLRLGGAIPSGKGFFYPPTVLTHVPPGMPAFDEETFGPVAAIIAARDAEHAVELANQSRFGLGASLWTVDTDRAETLARRVESGAVFINQIVQSDPRLPFGGVKDSGFGRELSRIGIREFVNVKTVWVE